MTRARHSGGALRAWSGAPMSELLTLGGTRADARVVIAKPRVETTEHSLVVLSRWLFNGGLFLSSLLALRFGGLAFGDLLLVASAVLLAISSAGRRTVSPTPALQAALFLVVIAGSVAAYRSVSVGSDFAVTVRLVYLVGVLPWQARVLLPDTRQLTHSARVWVAGAALCGAATLAQARFGAGVIPGAGITSSGRFSGLAQTVSDTGGITAIAFAFLLSGIGRKTSRKAMATATVCLGLSGIGLLLSGSVSGLLAVIATGVYLVLRRGLSARRLLALAFAGVVVLQVVGSVQHRTSGALTPLQRVEQATGLKTFTVAQRGLNTSESRLSTDRAGIAGFLRHPIVGVGLDPESGVVDDVDGFQVHNMFIGAAYQGGLVLLVGLLIPVVRAARRGWAMARTSAACGDVYASFIAALVFAMTAPSDYNRYFWVPLALVLAAAELSSARPRQVPSVRAASRLRAAVAA